MFSGGIEIGQWLKMGQQIDLLTKIALFQAVFEHTITEGKITNSLKKWSKALF